MKNPKNIAITGASSGLGKALAVHYAAAGITLHLQGRNDARLTETADLCKKAGAAVHLAVLDVTDKTGMETWLLAADAQTPIDLVIANAGISAGIGGGGENAHQSRAIFATNIDGANNTIQPLIPLMAKRGRGQIALVGSLAGMRGLASSPAYSASKGWARLYAEGLRGWLKDFGVEVNAVCPGFIRTPLTDVNPYKMPFIMSTEKAARIVAEGLAKNKARIAFPRLLYWPLWLLTCLPIAWTDPYFNSLPAKPSAPDRK
ncbi:MAG: SDR family NAD(P)-dependent oxidoreductase [Alphaproteobacteria bacterium]